MRWQGFASFKYYASAGIALIGLSAASTLLTDRISLAQTPPTTAKVPSEELEKLELVEKTLTDALGPQHPKVKEAQARLIEAQKRMQSAEAKMRVAERQATKERQIETRVVNGTSGAVTVTRVVGEDGNVLTENVQGQPALVLRSGGDGDDDIQEVLAQIPRQVRGLSLFGSKQNGDLKKAVDKLKDKEASEADKAAAKEKIVSILGQQFDEDMEQRGKQIAELEKKVTSLKEQIEKRKDAKKRMIDLRMELLMNESEGLGFPSSWQSSSGVGTLHTTLPAQIETRSIQGFKVPSVIAPAPPVPPTPPTPPTPPASPADKQ